jgi:hypothetical protein
MIKEGETEIRNWLGEFRKRITQKNKRGKKRSKKKAKSRKVV